MGILDSGSAPPTYVEPGEDRRQAGLFGLQMAQPFIQSYQSALNRSEQARQFDLSQRERVREFDLMAPLRAANVSHIEKQNSIADATLKSMTFKNDAEAMASQANAAYEGKKASALGFELQLGGDYSPQNQAKFLDFMSKNADLDRSPWATRMRENFASGQKYAQELKLVQERERARAAEDALQRRDINAQQMKMSRQNAAERVGVNLFTPEGTEIPGAWDDVLRKTSEKNDPAKIRSAERWGKMLEAQRPDLTPTQIEQGILQYTTDPKSIEPLAAEKKQIDSDDVAARNLDAIVSDIDRFNQKFGPNAFDKFTGPVDARIQRLRTETGIKATSEDVALARQIESRVETAVQGFRLGNFGTALSEKESAKFEKMAADPTSAAYLPTLKSFKETLKDSVQHRSENYPYSSSLAPINLRYKDRKPGEWFMGETPQAAPAPQLREVNKTYQTPKGELKWTGTGWVKP